MRLQDDGREEKKKGGIVSGSDRNRFVSAKGRVSRTEGRLDR